MPPSFLLLIFFFLVQSIALYQEKTDSQKRLYAKGGNTKASGKPFWTLIKPHEARQLAAFLLWTVAVNNREADLGAYHVNVTYGLKDADLDKLNQDLQSSATHPPDEEAQEPASEPPKKKKK